MTVGDERSCWHLGLSPGVSQFVTYAAPVLPLPALSSVSQLVPSALQMGWGVLPIVEGEASLLVGGMSTSLGHSVPEWSVSGTQL